MDGIGGLINNLIEIASFAMLLLAVAISIARTVHEMIPLYQGQSACLAVITALAAFRLALDQKTWFIIGAFTLIPILLAFFIEPLLAQATVPGEIPARKRLKGVISWSVRHTARQQAIPAWMLSRPPKRGNLLTLAMDLGLMALSFVLAYILVGVFGDAQSDASKLVGILGNNQIAASVMAVSFSLLLLGISTMINKDDILSQVIGLLVMEQGMFLAVVCLNPRPDKPEMMGYFIIGLVLYVFITLTILVFLLPELHKVSGSVEIDQQTQLKG